MNCLYLALLLAILPSNSIQEGQEAFSKEVKCLGELVMSDRMKCRI